MFWLTILMYSVQSFAASPKFASSASISNLKVEAGINCKDWPERPLEKTCEYSKEDDAPEWISAKKCQFQQLKGKSFSLVAWHYSIAEGTKLETILLDFSRNLKKKLKKVKIDLKDDGPLITNYTWQGKGVFVEIPADGKLESVYVMKSKPKRNLPGEK